MSDMAILQQLAILRGDKTVLHIVESDKSHDLQVCSNVLGQFEAKHAQLVHAPVMFFHPTQNLNEVLVSSIRVGGLEESDSDICLLGVRKASPESSCDATITWRLDRPDRHCSSDGFQLIILQF